MRVACCLAESALKFRHLLQETLASASTSRQTKVREARPNPAGFFIPVGIAVP